MKNDLNYSNLSEIKVKQKNYNIKILLKLLFSMMWHEAWQN